MSFAPRTTWAKATTADLTAALVGLAHRADRPLTRMVILEADTMDVPLYLLDAVARHLPDADDHEVDRIGDVLAADRYDYSRPLVPLEGFEPAASAAEYETEINGLRFALDTARRPGNGVVVVISTAELPDDVSDAPDILRVAVDALIWSDDTRGAAARAMEGAVALDELLIQIP